MAKKKGGSPKKKSKKRGKGKKIRKTPKVYVRMRVRKRRRVRRVNKLMIPQEAFDQEGVVVFTMKKPTEVRLECIVGQDVTAEIPWKSVPWKSVCDSLEINGEDSEFSPFESEILAYPRDEMLVIYKADDDAEEPEFYMCLTEHAADNLTEIINNIVELREENLKRMIYKTPRPWVSLHSEIEVDAINDKNNRSLLLTEIEGDYPPVQYELHPKRQLQFRYSQDAQDGYSEFLSTRTHFDVVYKTKLDAICQATPPTFDGNSQTIFTYNSNPKNASSQYEYDLTFADSVSKEFTHNWNFFMKYDFDSLTNFMDINEYIDLYSADYIDLVQDERTTKIQDVTKMKPFTFFMDINYCKGKQITSVSWHSHWTGIAAVAYGTFSLNSYIIPNMILEDVVTEAIHSTPPVLIWSFDDIVEPKLLLLSPRGVTAIDCCPFNENIIVGGCENGQIIIWDITDRLELVENKIVLTDTHQYYNMLMNSMTQWFKRSNPNNIVRSTVESQLHYSHSSTVTVIRWIDPYREITKCGLYKDIPEEEERLSFQFITVSMDGSVLFWDLNAEASAESSSYKPGRRKLKRLSEKPSALNLNVSPIRKFHRIFKPVYRLELFELGTSRYLPISAFNFRFTIPKYKEIDPNPNRPFNIRRRIKHKTILQPPKIPLLNSFVGGTSEGDFFVGSWEGFDYHSGAVVNKETCKFENIGKYHDGPVSTISRSKLVPELILTVGGKVFALWIQDFQSRPIFWSRSKGGKYTHGVWSYYRHSMFRLARSDGFFEIWQLSTRTDKWIWSKNVTGNALTGSYIHTLKMKQNVGAFSDTSGVLQVFMLANSLIFESQKDLQFVPKFCKHQVLRKTELQKWQDKWVARHTDFLDKQRELEELHRKEEAEARERELFAEEEAKLKEAEQNKVKPLPYWETIRKVVLQQEIEYIQQACLEKRGFVKEVLLKQRQPLINQQNEEIKLRSQLKMRLSQAETIFKDTVKIMFPEVGHVEIPEPNPYVKGETNSEYIESYEEIVEEYDLFIKKSPFVYYFEWINILTQGKNLRKALTRSVCSHKNRILRENNEISKGRYEISDNSKLPSRVEEDVDEEEEYYDETIENKENVPE